MAINATFERNKLFAVITTATDDEISAAIESHIKSSSVIAGKKYHDAIGSFFLRIEGVNDFKKLIIDKIKEIGPSAITFTKNEEMNSFKIKLNHLKQPAIDNSLTEELSIQANSLNPLVYYYTKREMSLLTFTRVHNKNNNTHIRMKRSLYLDVSNLVNLLKFVKEKRIKEIHDPLINFSKKLVDSALLEEGGPSEYFDASPVIAVGTDSRISNRFYIKSVYPYIKYNPNILKLKCLISHYDDLVKEISPNEYLKMG